MKVADLIAEVKKRMPDVQDCRVNHLDTDGGYFLCVWKGSARCVFFKTPNAMLAAYSGRTVESAAAASIVNDLQHE